MGQAINTQSLLVEVKEFGSSISLFELVSHTCKLFSSVSVFDQFSFQSSTPTATTKSVHQQTCHNAQSNPLLVKKKKKKKQPFPWLMKASKTTTTQTKNPLDINTSSTTFPHHPPYTDCHPGDHGSYFQQGKIEKKN